MFSPLTFAANVPPVALKSELLVPQKMNVKAMRPRMTTTTHLPKES
jgi:hypothetical protein